MPPFKVIIVGGSLSGLVLAKIFEEYGIDYVLLEKHEKVAPHLGAGFALWPNGHRVLEQLDCVEALENANGPVNNLTAYDSNGVLRDDRPSYGDWSRAMLGDQVRFMERRDAVQGIWDGLKDKSKVITATSLVKITCDADGVTAEASDGQVFHGDIIIGADGVHSRVQQEMQRIAAADRPGFDLFPDKDGIECSYSGVFGVAQGVDGISSSEAVRTYAKGRSYIACGGPDKIVYWIYQFKNEGGKTTQGREIPRYTMEDRDRLVARHINDQIKPGITLGDLFNNSPQSTLVPLEEGVLKTCYYRRMVLAGDSWHKIHPISGLGGNSAILSAASLGNQLHAFIGKKPSEADLQKAFQAYQKERTWHVQAVVKFAHYLQVSDALDSPLSLFMKRVILPLIPSASFLNMHATILVPSIRDEVKIKPADRPRLISLVWIALLVAAFWLLYPLQQVSELNSTWTTSPLPRLRNGFEIDISLYLQLSLTAITSIMCLESYRLSFSVLSILGSVAFHELDRRLACVLWAFHFILCNEAILLPQCASSRFGDGPGPGSCLFGHLPPAFGLHVSLPTLATKAWTIAHVALPLMLRLSKRIVERGCVIPRGPEAQYGKLDLVPLTGFLRLLYMVQMITSLLARSVFVNKVYTLLQEGGLNKLDGLSAEMLLLETSALIFFLFSLYDLRRVYPESKEVWMQLFQVSVAFVLSPTAALAWFWKDREVQWEEARQKKVTRETKQ
ncbi:hypothetical protein N7468_004812 [Penicillium chermesinum]|uniref:FAD-binding domain-containing protein n=1 Tax=Penicillium chermesinum TaxID=63820 RepID=A0A9W9PBH7_9EURO|nr:uncharacterized protein N7468_004812 [Penicillium chermesinum]KAJ5240193.1 hypothetical protein N7468_004812 [Penicillium chermesinum]